jgi:hypothetical protein
MPDGVRLDADADVLVASRTCGPGPSETFQRLAEEARMLCVYETDDDCFSVTPDNVNAYDVFSRPEIQANIKANLAAAHVVTVSTPTLAEVVSRHTRAPVVVLPNRVPRWLTELPSARDMPAAPTVDFGHTGGPSHVVDFAELQRPLRAFLRERPTARFVSFGTDNSPRVLDPRRGQLGGASRCVPWRGSVPDYLRSLQGLDVGLAPLRDTTFNAAKTPLKAMEYGALGAAVIASDAGPYADYVVHGVTGFLCGTAKDWRRALDALMDPGLRASMGDAGRAQARRHLIEDHGGLWLDAYQRAMSTTAPA